MIVPPGRYGLYLDDTAYVWYVRIRYLQAGILISMSLILLTLYTVLACRNYEQRTVIGITLFSLCRRRTSMRERRNRTLRSAREEVDPNIKIIIKSGEPSAERSASAQWEWPVPVAVIIFSGPEVRVPTTYVGRRAGAFIYLLKSKSKNPQCEAERCLA
jgi:hypothetical protein